MKLLIVDDHSILRAGISVLLKQENPDTVIIEASDGEQALALAEAEPDLDAVLLDLQMPGAGGQSALAEFGRRFPGLPVLIFTSTEDPEEVRKALCNGALGYVPKSASSTTLIGALKLVLQGDVYVPPLMLGERPRLIPADPTPESLPRLTQRQSDVLRLVQRGISNKLIARELGLSEKTVKVHVTSILRALKVTNRTAAINAVQELLKARKE